MTEVTKDVELARIVQPKFISLVGKPANQVAFKIIRDDNGEPTMTAHIQRKRTARRSEPLVSIEFEMTVPDEEISQMMTDWGITDYTLEATADGLKKRVKCSDAGDAATMTVKIGSGVSATILKPISQRSDAGKPSVEVTSVEFAKDYFPTVEDVGAWCRSNNVDFSDDAVENGDQQTVVRRGAKVEKGVETRRVEVDSGVQFVVVRADVQDVPQDFVAVVNDTAYGCWGWGQLDFTATMADVEFCEASEEAVYTLQRVAERIIFYSDLPISIRKELITAAAAQFADYVVTLMDALPARVVIANRSILEKEKSMSKANGQPVARTEAAAAAPVATPATETAATPAATPAVEGAPISRTDVAAMIGEAVAGISTQLSELTARFPAPVAAGEPVQRAEGAAAEGTAAAAPEAAAAAAAGTPAAAEGEPTLRDVLRSVETLGESVKGVSERVQSLEGTTTVRSDAGDGKQTARKDVFKGMFGGGKAA